MQKYEFFITSLYASERTLGLAKKPKLQHFLKNATRKETMEEKEIYRPGCLRNVNIFDLTNTANSVKIFG